MAANVTTRAGYHVTSACIIRRVAVTDVTDVSRAGYTCSGVHAVVVGWMFGGVGCHATSKGGEFSYKIGYLIMEALFFPIRPVCPDIIRILWISTFRGHYPHFGDISVFCGYFLHIVDIMDNSAFSGYYLYWSHCELIGS